MTDQLDYADIRRRAEISMSRQRRFSRIGFLIMNFVIFVVFVAISVYMVKTAPGLTELPEKTGSALEGAFAMLIIGWGTGIFLQLMSVLVEAGLFDKTVRGRVVANEIASEVMRLGLNDLQSEKPKRQAAASAETEMGLWDGELVPIAEQREAQRKADRHSTP